jgi:hypothetical protein
VSEKDNAADLIRGRIQDDKITVQHDAVREYPSRPLKHTVVAAHLTSLTARRLCEL